MKHCTVDHGGAASISTRPLSKFSAVLSSSLAAGIILLLPISAACAANSSPASQEDQTILVAAAADLAPLESSLVRASGLKVRFVLGSSGLLARQISQGAPYDAFLSADEKLVRDLAAAGRLVPASVRVYAFGRLGLWSKRGYIHTLNDLRDRRVLHVAIPNPAHAPYGVAARQALESQGVWKDIEPKILYGENVRQAFEYADSGNADAVITAWTLLQGRGTLLPDTWHAPIRQAGAVLSGSPHPAEAGRFLDFLCGAAGQAILNEHGLTPGCKP
jgi:molybdate transport system substrate-binding protein